jgi:uncharacterized protein YbjT (DUF2867 family)
VPLGRVWLRAPETFSLVLRSLRNSPFTNPHSWTLSLARSLWMIEFSCESDSRVASGCLMRVHIDELSRRTPSVNLRCGMKIVVIDGSGLIGSKLVAMLLRDGHDVVAASRRSGMDVVSGEGLAAAMKGASVVIDVTTAPSFEDAAVMKFFKTSTHNLLPAEAGAAVTHHVALSVVGAERLLHSGYLRAKFAQGRLIKQSPIPYSIIQATQFFEFLYSIADAATHRTAVRLPPVLIQPVAGDDVARAVARIATSAPLNGTREIGGPEPFYLDGFDQWLSRTAPDENRHGRTRARRSERARAAQ